MYNLHMKMHNIHMKSFYGKIQFGKKSIDGRFFIPSGIRCTNTKVIEKYFEIESAGIITTKSISIHPKEGYKEPLFVKYGENSYINAVGLSNPGAKSFKEELSKITIPENKFLLISIFGKDENEFYETAKVLYNYADGFELNMSYPHAQGYGLQIGNDSALVGRITKKMWTVTIWQVQIKKKKIFSKEKLFRKSLRQILQQRTEVWDSWETWRSLSKTIPSRKMKNRFS